MKKLVVFLILILFFSFPLLSQANDSEDLLYFNSIVSISSFESVANGDDYIEVSVVLKDQFKNIITNQIVYLNKVEEAGYSLILGSGITDEYGRVKFNVKTKVPSVVTLNVSTIDNVQVSENFSLTFRLAGESYTDGRFIKILNYTAVYFLDKKNVRHVYPTANVYYSYFGQNFEQVEVISKVEMGEYPLGENVPFKEGTLMKIPSVPKVYQVQANAEIRWLKSEEVAKNLYGVGWVNFIYDLPESFFMNYVEGEPIE